MRITGINSYIDSYTKQTSKVKEVKETKKSKDVLNISSAAKEYQLAQKTVNRVSDIRQDKIDEIMGRIESGTYNVSAEEIANKMVDSFFDSMA